MIIVALSGGKASAFCAAWALGAYPRSEVILYFNDTKWEHPDTYRFLRDLSAFFGHPITEDSDGRSPEQLFYDHHALANNRMPFCSHELKAERLQAYYQDGDTLIFGIGRDEIHRAERIVAAYDGVAQRTGKRVQYKFPLITYGVTSAQIDTFLQGTGVKPPALYSLGFIHNNCSGGCVRAGKKQWKRLYEVLPEVYAERERVEREVRAWLGKDVHFLKDETLEAFRGRIERGELSGHYDDDEQKTECIGVCPTLA